MPPALQQEPPAGRAKPRPAAPPTARPLLNRVVWRWHFWAGLLAGPVLIIASVTGALYLFKDEVQSLLYPHLLSATEGQTRLPLAQLVSEVQQELGDGWTASSIDINNQSGGVYAVGATNNHHDHRHVYINASTGVVLGELPEHNFFSIVLGLHRRLYAGTPGRVLVELTTCWTVLLVLTGLWLWWPRNWGRLRAALTPRLSGKRYTALRDLHAIPGALAGPIAALVAVTGLLYSVVWGTTFLAAGYGSGSFDIVVNPPQSAPSDEMPLPVGPDAAYATATGLDIPTARVSIALPHAPQDAYAIKSGFAWGPSISSIVHVDQFTGEVIQHRTLAQLPVMAQWTQWNYPLHVGSVMGLTTKLVWLLVCLVLTAAPVTGVWMWLQRKKPGTSGLPRRHSVRLPRWLVVSILLLGVLLPLAGVSMLLVGGFEWWRSRRERRAAIRTASG